MITNQIASTDTLWLWTMWIKLIQIKLWTQCVALTTLGKIAPKISSRKNVAKKGKTKWKSSLKKPSVVSTPWFAREMFSHHLQQLARKLFHHLVLKPKESSATTQSANTFPLISDSYLRFKLNQIVIKKRKKKTKNSKKSKNPKNAKYVKAISILQVVKFFCPMS